MSKFLISAKQLHCFFKVNILAIFNVPFIQLYTHFKIKPLIIANNIYCYFLNSNRFFKLVVISQSGRIGICRIKCILMGFIKCLFSQAQS